MNSKIVNPPNIGWIESKLEQPVIDFLWDIINDANNDYKGNLAGNISKSLKLVDKNNYFFNNIALPHSKAYLEKFKSPFIRQFESKKNLVYHLKICGLTINISMNLILFIVIQAYFPSLFGFKYLPLGVLNLNYLFLMELKKVIRKQDVLNFNIQTP